MKQNITERENKAKVDSMKKSNKIDKLLAEEEKKKQQEYMDIYTYTHIHTNIQYMIYNNI